MKAHAQQYRGGLLLFLSLLVTVMSFSIPSSPHQSNSRSQRNTVTVNRRLQSNGRLAASTSQDASSTISQSAKESLLELLEQIPRNAATSQAQTADILKTMRQLEEECPTAPQDVVKALAGTWELVWTAQDPSQPESRRLFRSWINPLENQSYSNQPLGTEKASSSVGQSNPFLPLPIQERLEKAGYVTSTNLRSTQSIDLASKEVRNVVGLQFGKQRAALTVTVDFYPERSDPRRINVTFQACRFVVNKTPIDFTIPLGIIGPTGWLRTIYIDETMRVTRGHKGSVFVLLRPGGKART